MTLNVFLTEAGLCGLILGSSQSQQLIKGKKGEESTTDRNNSSAHGVTQTKPKILKVYTRRPRKLSGEGQNRN